jgi:thioesterase domain-containing protein
MAAEANGQSYSLDPSGQLPVHGSSVVTIQTGSGSKPPLFCVHAEAGGVSLYSSLAHHLSPDQQVFGLCAPSAGEPALAQQFEQIAARHVSAIRSVQPEGPFLIAGECTGGALAYEIAQQLSAAGGKVGLLALVDAFPSGVPPLAKHMPRPLYRILHRVRILGFHFGNLVRLDMGERVTYVAVRVRRASIALMARASRLLSRSAENSSPQLTFRHALAAYTPRSSTGSMVLFRAARLPVGIEAPPDLGWGSLVEHLSVETIPGYFGTPISEPGVRTLAGRLSEHLASVGRDG